MSFWKLEFNSGEGSSPPERICRAGPPDSGGVQARSSPAKNESASVVSIVSSHQTGTRREKSAPMNWPGIAVDSGTRNRCRRMSVFLSMFVACGIFLFGLGPPSAEAIVAGSSVDNSARLTFNRFISGETIAFTSISETVTLKVELVSKVDVLKDLDTQFVRTDTDYVFTKRIQNLANGTDTFTLKADSTLSAATFGFFIDADSNGILDTAIDPAVTQIVLPQNGETTVLVKLRLVAGIADRQVDTISIGALSKVDTDPSSDTAKLVLTVDVAPPAEVVLASPADSVTVKTLTPPLLWNATVDTGSGLSIYNIEVANASDSNFGAPVRAASVTATQWVVTPALQKGTYRWHVRASDTLGNISIGIDSRVFAIDTSFTITPVTPADGTLTTDSTPTFVWSGDGETFQIKISYDSAFTKVAETAAATAKTYTSAGLADSAYYWRVAGIDSAGLSGTSVIQQLIVSTAVLDTTPGKLLVSSALIQPSVLTVQELDTSAVAVFALGANKESVTISAIRLTHVGGMSASKVSQVSVYRDAGVAGAIDAADTLFGAGTYLNSAVTLTGAPFLISANDTANLLVAYRMGSSLATTDTFLVQIVAAADVTGTGGISSAAPTVTGTPVSGKVFSVRTKYPSVLSVTPADSSIFLPPQDETGILPIRIQFNIPIDTSNITTTAIRLVDETGANRTDTITIIDSRTIQIKATFADTQWPYGAKFEIRVSTSIKDQDAPADSLQSEFISRFQTLQNAQGEQAKVSVDGLAMLKIDSGDIDPSVKGVVAEVIKPDVSDALLAKAMNAVKGNPFLETLPEDVAVYDYKIKKRDPNDTKALIKLKESDFLNPVDVMVTVRKPTAYIESKGVPLNFRMIKLGHFNEESGQWEIMKDATLEDHGSTVTIKAPTKSFSLFGAFFAFAPTTVKESFKTYPNPADPLTTYGPNASGISWQGFKFGWVMPKAGSVTIRIYDFAGQLVRVIGPTNYAASANLFADPAGPTWDGRNGRGQLVLNGAYFVQIEIRYNDGTVEMATDRIAVVK